MVYINQIAVPIIRRKVDLYVTNEVDISRRPTGAEYSRWVNSLFEARGQIGLLAELATLRNGIDWDRDVEGMFMTKKLVLKTDFEKVTCF